MASHSTSIQGWALLVLGVSMLITPVSASWSNPMERFYSNYNNGLQDIIRNNCSETYALYLQNRHDETNVGPALRSFTTHSVTMTSEMVQCILENTPEFIKSKMAAAAIVLGLAPTIIATLGVRPQETAVLSVVGRRHLLAFATAVGSPALNAYRSSEYDSIIESLRDRSRKHAIRRFDPVITAISYSLAAASIANVGEVTYRLGAQTIFTVLPDSQYVALLWAFLGVFIHFMAGIALRMRVSSKVKSVDEEVTRGSWPVSIAKGQLDIMARRSRIIFTVYPESLAFFSLSLLTTVSTACHIIFGTLVFSSILFVSINDSLSIVARLMASAIMCRIIVTYELLILRETIEEAVNPAVAGTPKQVLSFR
ncbi:hypothetical protein ACHAPT_007642 [Fusarium lateritium]